MLFLIVTFVVCLPLVLFALSNTEIVRLGIWPTDYSLEVHLSLAILIAMAVAFRLAQWWCGCPNFRSDCGRDEPNVSCVCLKLRSKHWKPVPAHQLRCLRRADVVG
jgi:hypothetical protein